MTDDDCREALRTRMPVRMAQAFKERTRGTNIEHVDEFGDCQGFLLEYVQYPGQIGPEVEVYWQPSNLHYGYMPEDLEWAD